ncbi:putative methyl-accepting chemotaxis sensory transducer [Mobilicoccus pelagius NBRC 104925]|uniref:Putative methyl-accepting chemotaxis sensory transducer n=1 Tax=Mobilicoccus pelagius NBRC 104925 TaxID=1089455 RepID=H5UVQ4_9MICO|nr:putative methyl-accepting chemotaxis sensory transducer [Mobilicoccus pelagius NBRC 104925]
MSPRAAARGRRGCPTFSDRRERAVLGRVEDLADETSDATSDIVSQVEATRADAQSAIEGIDGIVGIITDLDGYQRAISDDVEERRNATRG